MAYLDLDLQRDGYAFFKNRARPFPELPEVTHLALEDPDQVESAMGSVATAGADVVVDCPPLDPPQVVRAQKVGDFLGFPFKAGGNDLRAFSRALSLHQARLERQGAANPSGNQPVVFALINECMRVQLNDRLLLKWVQDSGIFRFVGCLGRRIEFKDAVARGPNPWHHCSLLKRFIQSCLEGGGLSKVWESKARLLLEDSKEIPRSRHRPPFSGRGHTYPAPQSVNQRRGRKRLSNGTGAGRSADHPRPPCRPYDALR